MQTGRSRKEALKISDEDIVKNNILFLSSGSKLLTKSSIGGIIKILKECSDEQKIWQTVTLYDTHSFVFSELYFLCKR